MPEAAETLDERLIEAMVWPRRIRMSAWAQDLEAHKRHPTFRVQQWPYTREYGFTCECSGTEQEWRISIACFREMLPEARGALQRLYQHHQHHGAKKMRRARRKANGRARALLHRYLSKEQRCELRGTRAFTIRGQDGRTYRVSEGTAGNVFLLEDGKPLYSLCVVAKTSIPMYDLMLAQKVLLENSPKFFLRTARVRHLGTNATFDSGAFLLGEDLPVQQQPGGLDALPIDRADLDNPQAWVEARLREAVGDPDADATATG